MAYRYRVHRALAALFGLQNSDGGFPATQSGQQSGCWTTADILEAIFVAGTLQELRLKPIEDALQFLLQSQIKSELSNGDMVGGWPLFRGKSLCTMATGHAVAALVLAKNILSGTNLEKRLGDAIELGFKWLSHTQNSDGTWAPFPDRGPTMIEGRMVATFYACLPYYYAAISPANSLTLRRAIGAIQSAQKADGSWSNVQANMGNPADTARAVIVLKRAPLDHHTGRAVNRGVAYILTQWKGETGQWEIDTEPMFDQAAPAQMVVNKNTPCDVLLALSLAAPQDRSFISLLAWLMATQEDGGLWYLQSPQHNNQEISTWSTAEWVVALEYAWRSLSIDEIKKAYLNRRKLRSLLVLAYVIIFVLIVTLTPLRGWALQLWQKIPETMQSFILGSVLVAVVVNVFSSYVYDWIARLRRSWSDKPENTSNVD